MVAGSERAKARASVKEMDRDSVAGVMATWAMATEISAEERKAAGRVIIRILTILTEFTPQRTHN